MLDHGKELLNTAQIRADAEKQLTEELNRSEQDMDVGLIGRLLAILEPDEPSAESRERTWQRLMAAERRKQRLLRLRSGSVWAARAAALVVLLVLTGFAAGRANALDWKSLRGWFAPEAETLRLYSSGPEWDTLAGNELPEVRTIQYASLDEMPSEIEGHRLKPAWLPERFIFHQGTLFTDGNMTKVDVMFTSERGVCILSTAIYEAPGAVTVDYEKLQGQAVNRVILGCPIQVYHNENGEALAAVWQVGSASHNLYGALGEEEMTRIIQSMLE